MCLVFGTCKKYFHFACVFPRYHNQQLFRLFKITTYCKCHVKTAVKKSNFVWKKYENNILPTCLQRFAENTVYYIAYFNTNIKTFLTIKFIKRSVSCFRYVQVKFLFSTLTLVFFRHKTVYYVAYFNQNI